MPGTSVVLAAGGRNRGPPQGFRAQSSFPHDQFTMRPQDFRGEIFVQMLPSTVLHTLMVLTRKITFFITSH